MRCSRRPCPPWMRRNHLPYRRRQLLRLPQRQLRDCQWLSVREMGTVSSIKNKFTGRAPYLPLCSRRCGEVTVGRIRPGKRLSPPAKPDSSTFCEIIWKTSALSLRRTSPPAGCWLPFTISVAKATSACRSAADSQDLSPRRVMIGLPWHRQRSAPETLRLPKPPIGMPWSRLFRPVHLMRLVLGSGSRHYSRSREQLALDNRREFLLQSPICQIFPGSLRRGREF